MRATKPKQGQEITSENSQRLEEYLGEMSSILARLLLFLDTEEWP